MSDKARGYPHKQDFCLKGVSKNKKKKNAWWQTGHKPSGSHKKKEE